MDMRIVKEVARKVSPCLRFLPISIRKQLLRIDERLIHYIFGENEEFLTDCYFGNIRAVVNTTYPVEKCFVLNRQGNAGMHNVLKYFLKEGSVAVDVGANVGLVTLAMAKLLGENGKVIAIEPGPFLYERLQKNLSLNPSLQRIVETFQVGISDKEGVLYWQEDMNNRGNAGLNDTEGIPVKVTTLDELLKDRERIDFIKIDIEGMEYEALRGGAKILAKHQPALIYETHPAFLKARRSTLFDEIRDLLESLGYELFDFTNGKLVPISRSGKYPSDTIAVHRASKHFKERK